jgi:hypothetical protein
MMDYVELERFISEAGDTYQLEYIKRLKPIFEYHALNDWTNELGSFIVDNTDISNNDVLDHIFSTISVLLDHILNINHVSLIDDTSMNFKIDLLQGLIDLNDYDDINIIENICNADYTNQEKLSTLLPLVTIHLDTYYLSHIIDVDDCVFRVILDSYKESIDEIINYTETVSVQIKRYSFFKNKVRRTMYGDRFFNNLPAIGLPLSVYMNSYVNDIPMNDNGVLDEDQIGVDLISMCLLSEDTSLPNILIKQYMHLITTDVSIATRIDVNIMKYQIGNLS